jgi:uncharacterized protein (TIRG00374 family)
MVGALMRRVVRSTLKLLFGLTLVVLLAWRFDLRAVGAALTQFRWPWLLGAIALTGLSWLVAALRWKLLANRVAIVRLFKLTLIGQFYAIVLPGQLAGELMKAWRLAKGHAHAERLATTILLDRVIGTASLLIVACGGIVLSHRRLPPGLVPLFAALILAAIAIVFALNLSPIHNLALRSVACLERSGLRGMVLSLHRAIDAWRELGRSHMRLGASLALGIIFQLLGVTVFALLARNLGIDLPFADWAWIFGLVSLAVLVPLSIGGIGLREGALVGSLGLLGIAGDRALALSFGIFAVALTGAMMGALYEIRHWMAHHSVPVASVKLKPTHFEK